MITTENGTTVRVIRYGMTLIVELDNPAAPPDMRDTEAGRIIDGGFQPSPRAAFAMRPDVLRAIAELMEVTA